MGFFAASRRRTRALASLVLLVLVAATVVVLAFRSEGFATTDVDLGDGGVWVTKPPSQLVGRVNSQAGELDAGVRSTSAQFDVLQDGDTVLLHSSGTSELMPIDPVTVTRGEPLPLPAGAAVAVGGGVLASLDPDGGTVRAGLVGSWAAVGPDAEPLGAHGAGASMVVTPTGTVHVLSTERGEVTSFAVGADGRPSGESSRGVGGLNPGDDTVLTAVGPHPVVLNRTTSTLHLPGGTVAQLPASGSAQVQLPGPARDEVFVATSDGLWRQPLGGGPAEKVAGEVSGVPAAPAVAGGCVHSAWAADPGRLVRLCAEQADSANQPLPEVTSASRLVFRVNRGAVVVNDLTEGQTWVPQQDAALVNNWDEVTPPPEDGAEVGDAAQESVQNTESERRQGNNPPVAQNDEYGVRAGRSTILPVLDNDSDADGDVLTVRLDGPGPSVGAVSPVFGGKALQVTVPAGGGGTGQFTYTADDGLGGTATATVTVNVVPPDRNGAPRAKRVPTVTLAQGRTIDYNVLPEWIDPDGDEVFVVGATTTSAGDVVRFLPDGTLTFIDGGLAAARKDVTVRVSDGTLEAEGVVRFDVRPADQVYPVANADHAVTVVGRPVDLKPLANDSDPAGQPLRLVKVAELDGVGVAADPETGATTLTPTREGASYLEYQVTNGPQTSTGLIRLDALPPAAPDAVPVAVGDTALLPVGRDTLVDVTANDTDPAGGVLVVQAVAVPEGSGVSAAVLDNKVLRVSDTSGLRGPVTLAYTVSNGAAAATGAVQVVPVPPPAQLLPPVASEDTATVRAGDVVTVPVLANDSHPNGDVITLDPELVEGPDPAEGFLFASENTLRFQAAGGGARTVHAVYRVRDSLGQEDSAQVTLHVRAADPQSNSAPRPRNLQARAIAGAPARIAVPLDGADPDGDRVSLVGITTAPTKGTVSVVAGGALQYTALVGERGTDTFTYTVADRLGARGTATVTVGVAPPNTANQAPAAVPDKVVVRPERNVSVPALANDADPDGDAISIAEGSLQAPEALRAEVDGDRVQLGTPAQPGAFSAYYTVVDARGATSVGTISVRSDPGAPLLAPVARDDILSDEDVTGKDEVEVPILGNDDDPDGSLRELQVAVDSGTAQVLGTGAVRVRITDAPQIIRYTLTDRDGLTGSAFIEVPGTVTAAPVLRAGAPPVQVQAGESVTIDLADYVEVAQGRTPRLTSEASVTALHSDGSPLVESATRLRYAPAPDYAGAAAISFSVTDGAGPDDPDGRTALLSIPITVTGRANQPPTFTGATVEVGPDGAGPALRLADLASDPDGDDLSFRLVGGPGDGFTAALDEAGGLLRFTMAADTPPGSAGTATVEVTDGQSDPVAAQFRVTARASERPPPQANDDVVEGAQQGRATTVDVLANDSDPFGQGLTLLSATVQTGDGTAAVAGDSVTVTPGADFVGTMVVAYRVADATRDPNRQAEGRVTLTVQGKPAAPSTPRVEEVLDRSVVLSWSPPANNGAEITHYTVRSPQGTSQQCQSTTCTVTGLANNVEHTFTVTATNAVGESEPSPASAPARPDAKPDTPQAPTVTAGDGTLAATWAAPNSPGSPVQSYTVEISPPPAGGGQATAAGTSHTFANLENGVAYRVRVQAHNRAPDPSEWSPYSAAATPVGPPATPAAPTATRSSSQVNGGVVDVAWQAVDDNGDPVSQWELQVIRDGAAQQTLTLSGGTLSQQVTGLDTASSYTFRVTARNRAGSSQPSPPSNAAVPYGKPGAVGAVTAVEGDKAATLTFTAPASNGSAITGYQVSTNNGGWADAGGGPTGVTVSGLANGTPYTFRVRAVNAGGTGDPSPASNEVTPSGPPGTPTVSASGGAQDVTFTWNPPATNGAALQRLEIKIDNGGWESVGAGPGSRTVGNGYSQTHSIEVRAVDTKNQTGAAASASATSGAAPPPPPPPAPRTVVLSEGGACSVSGVTNCRYLVLTLRNFPANSGQNCWWSRGGIDAVMTIGGNGSWSGVATTSDNRKWYVGTGNSAGTEASSVQCGGVTATAG